MREGWLRERLGPSTKRRKQRISLATCHGTGPADVAGLTDVSRRIASRLRDGHGIEIKAYRFERHGYTAVDTR